MRVVIQRVEKAKVEVEGRIISEIGKGLLLLVGIEKGDSLNDIDWITNKIVNLRIFDDETGIMNKSVKDIEGEILAVSQFTLTASTRKGNRPSYIRAAGHEVAIPLYKAFCQKLQDLMGKEVKEGIFGADMQVSLINDGPVTIIIDSNLRE